MPCILTVNRQQFVKECLEPLSDLVGQSVVLFEHDPQTKKIWSIVQHSNQMLALYVNFAYENFEQPQSFAVRDVGRLMKALDFVSEEFVTLNIEANKITYENQQIRFESPIVDLTTARNIQIGLKPQQFDNFEFISAFQLTKGNLRDIIKGRQFASSADIAEICSNTSGQITITLDKREMANTDRIKLTFEQVDGQPITSRKIPLEIFSMLSSIDSTVTVLTNARCNFIFSVQLNNSSLKYGQTSISER